jgi:outer membrane lipoprotein-sorting protein
MMLGKRRGLHGLATLFSLAICVAAGTACAQSPSINMAMLAKTLLKYRSLKTLSQETKGTMEIQASGLTFAARYSTKLQMAQPNRFRVETTISFFGQEAKGISVSDGKTVWDFDPEAKEYSAQPLEKLAVKGKRENDWLMDRAGMDFGMMFFSEMGQGKMFDVPKGIENSIEVKDYPTRMVDGLPTYVIPVPIPKESGQKGSAVIYAGASDLLIRRCRLNLSGVKDKPGEEGLQVSFTVFHSSLKPNVEIDEETFHFSPPEDAKKVNKVDPVFTRAFDKK